MSKIVNPTHMIEFVKRITFQTQKKELCDSCKNVYSEFGCHECGAKYCEKCWLQYHKFGKLATHKKINLDYYYDDSTCPVILNIKLI